MQKLEVGSRKADVAWPRVVDTAGARGGIRNQALTKQLDSMEDTGELGVGVDERASFGDQSSMSSTGGWQKKRKAVVRKESAHTQEYESCQQIDMEVDRGEDKEDMSFFPSALIESAGWYEPKFMCDRQSKKEGFKFFDIASIMVEDDGEPHTNRRRQAMEDNIR